MGVAKLSAHQPRVIPPLTLAEARELSTRTLAQRGFLLASEHVVDIQGLPPKGLPDNIDKSLSGLRLAFTPRPGWSGVCEATVVALEMDVGQEPANQDEGANATVKDVSVRSIYKIRGNLDLNADQDDAAFAMRCAKDFPFRDGYFHAPDGRVASDIGLIFATTKADAQSGKLSFPVDCEQAADCANTVRLLSSLDSDRIVSANAEDCLVEKRCYEIMITTAEGERRGLRMIKATAGYRGVGAKGWGILRVEKLFIEHEEIADPIPLQM